LDERSPAQLYCLVIGATLVVAGVLGFFYEASFKTGDAARFDDVLGILAVNGWHNVVHIASGALGLAWASDWGRARLFALGFGGTYVLLAIIGFIMGEGFLLDIVPLNHEDNVFHLLVGLAGLGAGSVTPAVPQPTTT